MVYLQAKVLNINQVAGKWILRTTGTLDMAAE